MLEESKMLKKSKTIMVCLLILLGLSTLVAEEQTYTVESYKITVDANDVEFMLTINEHLFKINGVIDVESLLELTEIIVDEIVNPDDPGTGEVVIKKVTVTHEIVIINGKPVVKIKVR
jgi:hypothetical protein